MNLRKLNRNMCFPIKIRKKLKPKFEKIIKT